MSLTTQVTRERQEGVIRYLVSGESTEALRKWDEIRSANEAKGRTVVEERSEARSVENPRIEGFVPVDLLAFRRFRAKVALGLGHALWGSWWSSGPEAQLLRRALWSKSYDEIDAVGFVEGCFDPALFHLRIQDHEHLFFWSALPNQGCVLAMCFFGQPGSTFQVAKAGSEQATGASKAILLDVRSGNVQVLPVSELVLQRAATLRRDR